MVSSFSRKRTQKLPFITTSVTARTVKCKNSVKLVKLGVKPRFAGCRQVLGHSRGRHGGRAVQEQVHETGDVRGAGIIRGQFGARVAVPVGNVAGRMHVDRVVQRSAGRHRPRAVGPTGAGRRRAARLPGPTRTRHQGVLRRVRVRHRFVVRFIRHRHRVRFRSSVRRWGFATVPLTTRVHTHTHARARGPAVVPLNQWCPNRGSWATCGPFQISKIKYLKNM